MALGQDQGGLGNPFAGVMPTMGPAVAPQAAPTQTAGFNPLRRRGGGNPYLSGPTTNYSSGLGSLMGILGMPTFEERQATATSAAAATFSKLVQSGQSPSQALLMTMGTPEGQAAMSDPTQWNSFVNTVQAATQAQPSQDPLKLGQYDTAIFPGGDRLYGSGIDPKTGRAYPDLAGGVGTEKERYARMMTTTIDPATGKPFWTEEQGRAHVSGQIEVQVIPPRVDQFTGQVTEGIIVETNNKDPLNPVVTSRPLSEMAAAGVQVPSPTAQQPITAQQPVIVPQQSPLGNIGVEAAREALGQVESSGRYGIKGPYNKKQGYPLGKYQIMEANLPSWSKEALGRSVGSEEFLQSPELQDQVATYQMQKLYNKYGNWDDVASAWLTGRPRSKTGGAKDVYGTEAPEYIRRFRAALGQTGGGVSAPSGPPPGWNRLNTSEDGQWYKQGTQEIPYPEEMFDIAGVGSVVEPVGKAAAGVAGPQFAPGDLTGKKAAIDAIGLTVQGLKDNKMFASEVETLTNLVPRYGIFENEISALDQAISSVTTVLRLKQQAVAVLKDLSASQEARKLADEGISSANKVLQTFPDINAMRQRKADLVSGKAQMRTWLNSVPGFLRDLGAFTTKAKKGVSDIEAGTGGTTPDHTADIAKLRTPAEALAYIEAHPGLTPSERAAINAKIIGWQGGGQ